MGDLVGHDPSGPRVARPNLLGISRGLQFYASKLGNLCHRAPPRQLPSGCITVVDQVVFGDVFGCRY